jgi:hypothetical protein
MSESKEGDPIMASRGDYAQSECHCALYSNNVTYPSRELCLIVSLFQENKSFGASTIFIHPLMYRKPCREQSGLPGVFCTRKFFIYFYLGRLPGVFITGESRLPGGEYTGESQLPSGLYTGESPLPVRNTPGSQIAWCI